MVLSLVDFMDYYRLYGLYGLLICLWNWFGIHVVYICICVHVVLRLYIDVIFVYGVHQKIGETLVKFSTESTYVQYTYSI